MDRHLFNDADSKEKEFRYYIFMRLEEIQNPQFIMEKQIKREIHDVKDSVGRKVGNMRMEMPCVQYILNTV